MLTTIIKFLFIYLGCVLICQKSFNSLKLNFGYNCALSCALSIIMCVTSIFVEWMNFILPLLLLWILTSILNSKPQISFIAITISFTISFSIHMIISFLLIALLPFLRISQNYFLLALATGIIQTVLIMRLLSLKRFKKGIPFLSSSTNLNIATFVCLLFIGFTIYISLDYLPFHIQALGLFSFIIIYAFLIFWWQAQITKAYRHQLELRASESLRTENARLLLENRMLTEDKDRMAYITHRDNTLITTLKNATLNYLSTDYSDSEEALKARDELIANIEALSAGRASLPDNYNEKQAKTFDTNFTLLNKLLHQMDADAIQQNIMFSVHFGVMLDEFVPRDISEMDLAHTVDDLLKNAFKATRNSEPRMVQLQFYRLGKHFVVEVADNGIPFEVRSLVNMGIEKLTTYEDGSGIGLVDIWSTKEKCGATYHLEEYVTPSPFSKKISLTFDKKNRYSIRTWRKDEILQMSRRADLQVYEHME